MRRATEIVWCADPDGVVDTVTWEGHDGPLTELDVQVVELDAGALSAKGSSASASAAWPIRDGGSLRVASRTASVRL